MISYLSVLLQLQTCHRRYAVVGSHFHYSHALRLPPQGRNLGQRHSDDLSFQGNGDKLFFAAADNSSHHQWAGFIRNFESFDARTASFLEAIIFHARLFAVTFATHIQEKLVFSASGNRVRPDQFVFIGQPDAPHSGRRPPHRPNVGFFEHYGLAVFCRHYQMVAFGRELDELQLVAFFQSYRRYPVSPHIFEAGGIHFFDHAVFGGHHQKALGFSGRLGEYQNGSDFFVGRDGQDIHHRLPFRRPFGFRQFKHFHLVNFALVAEKKQVIVGIGRNENIDEVFFFGFYVYHSHSASFLRPISVRIRPFYIPAFGQHHHLVFGFHQIFVGHRFGGARHDFRPPLVAVFFSYRQEFVFYHFQKLLRVGQERPQIFYQLLFFFELVFNFLPFQIGQRLQLHFQNGDSLLVRKFKLGHQLFLGVVSIVGSPDGFDNGVNVIKGFLEAFQYMSSVQCSVQIKLRSPSDDNFPMRNKILEDVFQS